MEERNTRAINYRAIAEMAGTEGWQILEEMLAYDVKFADSLLGRPKPQKAKEGEQTPEPKYIIELHEIGRARGLKATAEKYMTLVKIAKEKNKN